MDPNSEAQIASKEFYDMLVDIEYSSQSHTVDNMFYSGGEDESDD